MLGIGSTELAVIAGTMLVLFASRLIPEFAKGLGDAFSNFRDASDEFGDEAGHSLRDGFGRRVFEALTLDNRTAELHDPPPNKAPRGVVVLIFLFLGVLALALFLTVNKII